MSVEENKRIAERFLDLIMGGCHAEAVAELCVKDVLFVTPANAAHGLNGLTVFLDNVQKAFPDWRVALEFSASEGDSVACRLNIRATHQGPFPGIRPTERKVSLPQMWIFSYSGNLISKIEVFYDLRLLIEQTGMHPPGVVEQ